MTFYMRSGFLDPEGVLSQQPSDFSVEEFGEKRVVLKSGSLSKTITLSDGYEVFINDYVETPTSLSLMRKCLGLPGEVLI